MSRKKLVDARDIQMLNILKDNGRITSKELSERIGLSEGPTHTRLINLLKREIITDVTANIDYSYVGYKLQALVWFRVVPAWLTDLMDYLDKKMLVLRWFVLTPRQLAGVGVQNVMAVIPVKSEKQLESLLYELVANVKAVVAIEYFELYYEKRGSFAIPGK